MVMMLKYPKFLALALVSTLAKSQTIYRQGDGDLFIRDGIVNLVGFTGTVFQVINYMPVCGTLSSSLTRQIDLSDKCTAAMSTFNTTSPTSGIYDLSGVASSQFPGGGTQLCICGAFGTSTAKAGDPKSNGLLCVWVDEKGFEEEWWSGYTDTRVASSFQLSALGKALPPCNSVDLASLSAASLATRTADVSSATPKATTTAGSGKSGGSNTPSSSTSTVRGPNSSSTASSSSSGSGSSTVSSGTIIGLVVAAVLVVIASIAAACLCYRRGQRHSLPPLSSQALQSSQLLDEQKPTIGRRSSWWAESQAGRVNDWNENVRR